MPARLQRFREGQHGTFAIQVAPGVGWLSFPMRRVPPQVTQYRYFETIHRLLFLFSSCHFRHSISASQNKSLCLRRLVCRYNTSPLTTATGSPTVM